jgi:hypothetical protein
MISRRAVVFAALCVLIGACAPPMPPQPAIATQSAVATFAGSTWREVAMMPVARGHLSAVALNGAIFTIGGSPRGSASSLAFERYDPSTDAWTSLAALPVGTDHAAAAALSSSIFVFGGTFELPSTRAYRIDLPPAGAQSANFAAAQWRPIAPLPEPRSAGGAAAIGGRIYVVGGFDGTHHELASAHAYDPAADAWRRIADLPTPREHLAVTEWRGQVCALGGHVGNGVGMTTVECYDPLADRWSSRPPLPRPASDFGAATVGDAIWAAGDDVQVFDGTRWWLGPPLLVPRFGVAVVSVDGALLVIGGGSRKPAPDGIVERLDVR